MHNKSISWEEMNQNVYIYVQHENASFNEIRLRLTADCDIWRNVAAKTVVEEEITGDIIVEQQRKVGLIKHNWPDADVSLIHVIVKAVNTKKNNQKQPVNPKCHTRLYRLSPPNPA